MSLALAPPPSPPPCHHSTTARATRRSGERGPCGGVAVQPSGVRGGVGPERDGDGMGCGMARDGMGQQPAAPAAGREQFGPEPARVRAASRSIAPYSAASYGGYVFAACLAGLSGRALAGHADHDEAVRTRAVPRTHRRRQLRGRADGSRRRR